MYTILVDATEPNGISIVGEQQIPSAIWRMESVTSNGSWIRCFPNPTTGVVYFEIFLPKATKVELNIYDYTGRKVMTKTTSVLPAGKHLLEMDFSEFADGQYLFEAVSDADAVKGKVVVMGK